MYFNGPIWSTKVCKVLQSEKKKLEDFSGSLKIKIFALKDQNFHFMSPLNTLGFSREVPTFVTGERSLLSSWASGPYFCHGQEVPTCITGEQPLLLHITNNGGCYIWRTYATHYLVCRLKFLKKKGLITLQVLVKGSLWPQCPYQSVSGQSFILAKVSFSRKWTGR